MSSMQPQPQFPGLNNAQPQPQTSPLSPQANQLTQQQQPQIAAPQTIQRGSIIVFPYSYWKNDPVPCVLVSSIDSYYMRGVNLHYLTFLDTKRLLVPNPSLTYYIKVVKAFRTYLVRGIAIEKAKIIDAKFLLQMMAMVKSFDPLQIRAIREEIERQLTVGYPQPQANPTGPTPYGTTAASQQSLSPPAQGQTFQ